MVFHSKRGDKFHAATTHGKWKSIRQHDNSFRETNRLSFASDSALPLPRDSPPSVFNSLTTGPLITRNYPPLIPPLTPPPPAGKLKRTKFQRAKLPPILMDSLVSYLGDKEQATKMVVVETVSLFSFSFFFRISHDLSPFVPFSRGNTTRTTPPPLFFFSFSRVSSYPTSRRHNLIFAIPKRKEASSWSEWLFVASFQEKGKGI